MFDAESFLEDHNISYDTEGKNCSPEFLNIPCLWHDDNSNHLGIHRIKGFGNCWHCGWLPIDKIISKLLNCSSFEARKIMQQYDTDPNYDLWEERKEKQIIEQLSLPAGAEKIKRVHRDYLIKRNFDPDEIESTWGIKGTGHIGDYKFRIIIPIHLNGNLISYVGRDITGKASLRYKACKKRREILFHKHSLYGIDFVINRKAILVEGITDVWRFGKGAIATFGTGYTKEQLLMISNKLDEVSILFDNDALEQSKKIYFDLVGVVKNVNWFSLPKGIKDPADLDQEQARKIKKNLINQ